MNHLQIRHLKRFCRNHGLDSAEIDTRISYSENKEHLTSLVPKRLEDLVPQGEAQLEDYMTNHFLVFYVACVQEGTTQIKHARVPEMSKRFSLRRWVNP